MLKKQTADWLDIGRKFYSSPTLQCHTNICIVHKGRVSGWYTAKDFILTCCLEIKTVSYCTLPESFKLFWNDDVLYKNHLKHEFKKKGKKQVNMKSFPVYQPSHLQETTFSKKYEVRQISYNLIVYKSLKLMLLFYKRRLKDILVM